MRRCPGTLLAVSLVLCCCVCSGPAAAAQRVADDSLAAGERVEQFRYVVSDTEEKTGTCRVLTLDLGNGITMDVVRVSAGKFTMGSPPNEKARDDDEVAHEVTLTSDFYLGKYEVTQEQYEAVIGNNPSRYKGKRQPVESVNPDEAAEFCRVLAKKLGRRVELPSEAQWEFACRAGATTPYHFGTKLDGSKENVGGKQAVDVGGYKPNGFGLHDMHGNVKEYCRDFYGPYSQLQSSVDPVQLTRLDRDLRVVRGGSFYRNGRECRAADRVPCEYAKEFRANDIGFRVCIELN